MPRTPQVKEFFETYIFGYMCADIERELNLARIGESAGNFLCALGLLSYTEFMGGLYLRGFRDREAGKRFRAFFDYLGPDYAQFQIECDVYDVFRCGLVHEYFVKHACTIFMLNGPDPLTIPGTPPGTPVAPSLLVLDETIEQPVKAGIGRTSDERYFFIVEKYYQDFRSACERLYKEIEADPDRRFALDPSWWFIES